MSTTAQPGKMPVLSEEEKEEELTHLVEVITDPKESVPINNVIHELSGLWKAPEDPAAKLKALLGAKRSRSEDAEYPEPSRKKSKP